MAGWLHSVTDCCRARHALVRSFAQDGCVAIKRRCRSSLLILLLFELLPLELRFPRRELWGFVPDGAIDRWCWRGCCCCLGLVRPERRGTGAGRIPSAVMLCCASRLRLWLG